MRDGAGCRSSPLDDLRPMRWTAQFTHQLLQLLCALEATVERQPELAELLGAVIAGSCSGRDELLEPEARERQAPTVSHKARQRRTYTQVQGLG